MFGVGASIDEPSKALVTTKLSLFWKLFTPQSMCIDSFTRWQTTDKQGIVLGGVA
jgi:hypothetical protein